VIVGTILVLEDNVLVSMEIEDELAARGHVVAPATDLGDAAAICARVEPFAALLDLRLPDGDSIELATRLRAAGCHIAFTTGMDDGHIPSHLADLPRFTKPVSVRVLADWIDALTP